jgi:hypothetical protein
MAIISNENSLSTLMRVNVVQRELEPKDAVIIAD